MLDPEFMTPERWISLLKAAKVENFDDVTVVVLDGPAVMDNPKGGFYAVIPREHTDQFTAAWSEIKEEFNGNA